jgi:hypothetical protein
MAQACEAAAAAMQQQTLPESLCQPWSDSSTQILDLWRALVNSWPQANWCVSNAQLAATVEPVAQLAYCTLQQQRSPTAGHTSAAVQVALELACGVKAVFAGNSNTQTPNSRGGSVVAAGTATGSSIEERQAALVQSDSVLKLLLLRLACEVEQQHKQLSGKSAATAMPASAGASKLAVPKYHTGRHINRPNILPVHSLVCLGAFGLPTHINDTTGTLATYLTEHQLQHIKPSSTPHDRMR